MQFSRIGYIYALTEPTGEVRYIGQSVQPALRRLSHISEAKAHGRSHKDRWIRKVSFEPVLLILRVCSLKQIGEHEKGYIKYYRAMGATLVNKTDGGDGAPGYQVTPEQRQRSSEARKGKPATEAQREALLRGARKPKSLLHRGRMSAYQRGRPKVELTDDGRGRLKEAWQRGYENGNFAYTDTKRQATADWWATISPEERTERARQRNFGMWGRKNPEERQAVGAKIGQALLKNRTPEQRRALGLKGGDAAREAWATQSPEKRAERLRKMAEGRARMTPEQYKARGETNHRRQEEKKLLLTIEALLGAA